MLRLCVGDLSARDNTHIFPMSEIQGVSTRFCPQLLFRPKHGSLKPSLNNLRFGARCTLRFMLPLTGCLLAELRVSAVQERRRRGVTRFK